MHPLSPRRKNTLAKDLNIDSVLAFSEQQDALIAAQQQVTQRVMDNNHMLREALQQEHERAERFRALYEAEKAKNAQLAQRIRDLEKETIHVNGNYVEHVNIEKLLTGRPVSKSKRKTFYTDLTNQLPLWTNQEPST